MPAAPERQLRRIVWAGWVLFGAMFLPVAFSEPESLPVLAFWFIPFSLPFWFGLCAALAARRVAGGRGVGRWAGAHIAITVIGVILLPLWLVLMWEDASNVAKWAQWASAVFYLALLPAAATLLLPRSSGWRLFRAMTLNAVGCLLAVVPLVTLVPISDLSWATMPGPSPLIGVPALVVIALTARKLELRVREQSGRAEFPKARVAHSSGVASRTSATTGR